MSGTEFSADQLRRSIIQRLEDLRRAGLTHWNRGTFVPVVPLPADSVTSAANRVTLRPVDSPHAAKASSAEIEVPTVVARDLVRPDHSAALNAGPSKSLDDVVPSSKAVIPATDSTILRDSVSSDVAKKKAIVPVSTPCSTFTPLNLPLKERVAGLAALAARVAQCTRCSELASSRTQTVFGVGNPEAKILFVGEAPGADEDAQGEPFVGKSGQLLNDIIKACRMRREDIYICNVLRCRPPGNRLPAPEEAANCREYLDGQIGHVNPDYIVCWGACAAQNLLAATEPIGKLRGRFHQFGRAKVLCTYHPSYLLRNPAAKKDVWEDMKLLFLDMGIDLSAKPS